MAALRSNKIISIPLRDAIARNRTVDDEMILVAEGILDTTASDKEAVRR